MIANANKSKILLIDEIGPLQLQSAAFIEAVEMIRDDPTTTLFATIALDDRKGL
jgi:nucleoside-triphosphatase THEP1